MDQYVERAAGRRRIHHLNADTVAGELLEQRRSGKAERQPGAENENLRLQLEHWREIRQPQLSRLVHQPGFDDAISGHDHVPREDSLLDVDRAGFPAVHNVGGTQLLCKLHAAFHLE